MVTKAKFQAIKGTRDLVPPETALWTRVEQTAHEVFASYNFGEIRLPVFESTDLFARAVGGETDIVSKEMYTFFDRLDEGSALAKKIKPFMQETLQKAGPPEPGKMLLAKPPQDLNEQISLISLRPEATAS